MHVRLTGRQVDVISISPPTALLNSSSSTHNLKRPCLLAATKLSTPLSQSAREFLVPRFQAPLVSGAPSFIIVCEWKAPMLDSSARSLIWSCMSHLSPDERQEAVELLVYIGIMNTPSFKINIQQLRQAYDQCKQVNNGRRLLTYDGNEIPSTSRAYRLNAMSTFPFADEKSSMYHILHAKDASIRIQEMGAPARARVIQVTYESMLSGRKYMKIDMIPDALAVREHWPDLIFC